MRGRNNVGLVGGENKSKTRNRYFNAISPGLSCFLTSTKQSRCLAPLIRPFGFSGKGWNRTTGDWLMRPAEGHLHAWARSGGNQPMGVHVAPSVICRVTILWTRSAIPQIGNRLHRPPRRYSLACQRYQETQTALVSQGCWCSFYNCKGIASVIRTIQTSVHEIIPLRLLKLPKLYPHPPTRSSALFRVVSIDICPEQ